MNNIIKKFKNLKIISFKENQGFGGGILAGLQACSSDVLGFTCADTQIDVKDIVKGFQLIKSKNLDIVKTRRIKRYDGFPRFIFTKVFNNLCNILFNLQTNCNFVKKKLAILFGLAFVFRMVLAFGVYHPDLRNHMDWGIRFWDYGPEKFYTANVWSYTWPNQPPGTIYIFAGVRKLFEAVFGIFWWINTTVPPFPSQMMFFLESNLYPALLKLPAILADLGIAFIIYKLLSQLKSKRLGYFGALVFLVNPVVWYNSSVWGQTDSIINFVALAAFYLLLKRQLLLAVMVLSLSLYIKVSLLIFVPVFAIIVVRQKYKLVEILNAVVFSLLAVLFITLPFAPEAPHNWLFRIYKDKVFAQQLHVITANGFNIWSALTGIHEQPDSLIFAIINYRTWGYIIFAGFLVL